jgi:signal transduction histidine kinase
LVDSNYIWCATDYGIYQVKNGHSNFIFKKEYKTQITNVPYSVKQIIADSDGNIYATCFNNIFKLYKYHQNMYFSQVLDSIVRTFSIVEYKKNKFIFSGLNGLFEYSETANTCSRFETSTDFSSERGLDMKIDSDSLLIVATDGGGLYVLQNKQVLQHFSSTNGLSSDNCKQIYIDGNRMYIATDNGLNILLKKNKWIISEIITTKEGLPSNSINSIAVNDKNVFIGTDAGLSVLNKVKANHEAFIAKVKLTELITDSIESVSKDHYYFNTKIPRLVIRFAYPVFNSVNITNIKYRLIVDKKINENWIVPTNNEVEFSSLTPGSYTFQLKPDLETLQDNITSFYFEIRPMWWQTKVFRISFACVVFLITVISARKITQKRYERQMIVLKQKTALEIERNRIASDMHDDLGADLTYISILGEMMAQTGKLENNTLNNLYKITDTSKKVIDKMGEIIWALNSSNDSLANLISYLHKYSKLFLESKNIDCSVRIPSFIPDKKLTAAYRRNTFLIFKEALNNIVKHSNTCRVELIFFINEDELIMSIKDFGTNVSRETNNQNGGNGLANMKKRALENDGTLEILFSENEGTLIQYQSKI